MKGYASALRKNPFSRVAHAAALGKEVMELTVRTAGFKESLEVVARREVQGEPLAMVVLGPAGSGKTHFLKFLEHTYKPRTESWRDKGESSEDREEPQFHRVIFVPNPGNSFTELVRRVVQGALDPETLGRLVDRLLAFPARALCLEKARQNEEPEANQQLAQLLRRNPKEIDKYWSRFSKSEIYNAALSTLEQISRHSAFRDSFAELLRARRDGVAADYDHVVRKLLEQWLGVVKDSTDLAPSKKEFEAVQLAESVLALLDLLEIRLLLMMDECQVVLRGDDSTSENVLFRQLVNATPRGSVMAFAMRTEDWLRFADEASERRVRFQKVTVNPEECWEIILRYIVVKGGNPHLTITSARQFFPQEAASFLWSATGGVVGRVLALCYEVHERLIGERNRLVVEVVREVIEGARGAVIARPSVQEVARSVEDIVRNTCTLLGREVRKGSRGFNFEVREEGILYPTAAIALRQANSDVEEARSAHDIGKAILQVRETSPRTHILVVVSGYKSSEVTEILGFLADRVIVFDENQWDSRATLSETLRELVTGAKDFSSRPGLPQEGIQWVDELAAVVRRRMAENSHILRSGPRLRPIITSQWERMAYKLFPLTLAVLMVTLGMFLFQNQVQERQRAEEEVENRYREAMSDFLGGQPAKAAVALGEIERILSKSPRYLEATRSSLAAYLRFSNEKNPQMRQEVLSVLNRLEAGGGRPSDLRGAQLFELDMRGIDMRGRNLADANLSFSDLQEAKLQEADLRRAQLVGANLRGADLRKANLLGADLRRADLRGANLAGVVSESLRDACGDERTILPAGTRTLPACSPTEDGL